MYETIWLYKQRPESSYTINGFETKKKKKEIQFNSKDKNKNLSKRKMVTGTEKTKNSDII